MGRNAAVFDSVWKEFGDVYGDYFQRGVGFEKFKVAERPGGCFPDGCIELDPDFATLMVRAYRKGQRGGFFTLDHEDAHWHGKVLVQAAAGNFGQGYEPLHHYTPNVSGVKIKSGWDSSSFIHVFLDHPSSETVTIRECVFHEYTDRHAMSKSNDPLEDLSSMLAIIALWESVEEPYVASRFRWMRVGEEERVEKSALNTLYLHKSVALLRGNELQNVVRRTFENYKDLKK